MKKKIFLISILLISMANVSGQTQLFSKNCNTLEVKLDIEESTVSKVYLEQQLQKNIWVKIAEKRTSNNHVIFEDLNNGIYRSTFVPLGEKWDNGKFISNVTEISCDFKKGKEIDFTLFPNPASKFLTVSIQNQKIIEALEYEIFNELGTLIVQGESEVSDFKINLQNAINGAYIIKISYNGMSRSSKFLISK